MDNNAFIFRRLVHYLKKRTVATDSEKWGVVSIRGYSCIQQKYPFNATDILANM